QLVAESVKVGYDVRPRRLDPLCEFQNGTLLAFVTDRADQGETLLTMATDPLPEIVLRGVDDATMTVFLDRFYVEGKASSGQQIASLKINGREMMNESALEVHFASVVDLQEATNTIQIAASDKNNVLSERTVQVLRVVPDAQSLGTRLSLTISPLEVMGEASQAGSLIEDRMMRAFVAPKRFRILDRASLDTILLERKLSATDLADPSTAAQMGRLQDAEFILTGFVRHRVAESGLEIMGRLVETETGRVLFEHDVYDESVQGDGLSQMLEGLYLKFARHFPLLGGPVLEAGRQGVSVELPYTGLARAGMRFVVYREGKQLVHPVTGRVLGAATTILGEAIIERTVENGAFMKVLDGVRVSSLSPGDRVIAR
ncbi:MAG TPA: CsgG/HfaB family protein, partial [bacterium]|nr:CsgG/HfaB family protein [bacterium]